MKPRSGLSLNVLASIVVLLGTYAQYCESAGDRMPVPSMSDREAALADVRTQFAEAYRSAVTTDEKVGLCKRLISSSQQVKGEPARCFVLLDVARRAAIQLGDTETAIEAVSMLSRLFVVDGIALQATTLRELVQHTQTEAQQKAAANCAVELLETMAASSPQAEQVYDVAVQAVRATRDAQLVRRVQAWRQKTQQTASGTIAPRMEAGDAVKIPPPRVPSLEKYAKPGQVRLPRATMLAAWERLRNLKIPGVEVDQRYQIDGQEYYVSPSGDDAADGSQESPWRTLAHAVTRLEPNSVVYLHAGTYYGPVTIHTRATKEATAALRAVDGESVYVTYPQEWISERAAEVHRAPTEGHKKALDAEGKELHYAPLLACRGTYVEISGLHLIGVRDLLPHNLYSENGISFEGGGGEGCRVLYNEIEAFGHCGVKEMNHGGHSILIEGNYIHNIGQAYLHDHCIYAPADDMVVRKNLLLNAVSMGVKAGDNPSRFIATHNIVAGNGRSGILLAGPDAIVAHNVFGRNHESGILFFRAGCTGAVVKNNLFFDTVAVSFDEGGHQKWTPSGNLFDHNCLSPATKLGRLSPLDTVRSGNFQADPMVADAANLDFRPHRRSPCIGAGAPIAALHSGKAPSVGLYETSGR